MEIRAESKTGSLVPSLADITAMVSQQIDSLKGRWLDRLAQDPANFAHLEVEIHDHFRHLADQVTASLLAEATNSGDQGGPEKKGGLAGPTGHDAPRSRGG